IMPPPPRGRPPTPAPPSTKREGWAWSWKIGLTFGVIGALIIGGMQLWKGVNNIIAASSWGRFESVKVEGLTRLTEDMIVKAARVKLGGSLYKLPLDAIAARVTALPAVRAARVRRRIPRQLAIQVEEREPIAALAGNPLRLVDKEGVIFPLAQPGEMIDKPFITGDAAQPQSSEFKRAIAFLNRIVNDYPQLYNHLGELSVRAKEVELRLSRGGAEVLTNGWNEDRLGLLELYLKEKSDNLPSNLSYLDMRYPNLIIAGTGFRTN
ncbi:MAG: FtsQ-type POTRA domain-containing protein, partial [Calditrichota bacterium]